MGLWNSLVRCLAGSSIAILCAADLSLPSEYEGKPIHSIRFEPAFQPVSQKELARLIPVSPGTPLKLDDVRELIKRLFATGEYQNIEVGWEPSGDGVDLVFHTTEQWFTGPVEVRGRTNSPPNRGQLANAARLELGEPFNDEDIAEATRGIVNLMHRNGLYRSTVTPEVERDNEHQLVFLTFLVNAGKRARLTTPDVTGDTRIPKETIQKAADYKGWFGWKPATAANTQGGLEDIRDKYAKEDRLTASVKLEKTDYNAATNRVKPTIRADGGPRVKIVTEGAHVPKRKLKRYIPVYDEETVNRDLLVRGVANLRDYFQDRGYFDVDVDFQTKQLAPDLEQITYMIERGDKHRVVKVRVVGNRYFDEDVIRERMFIREKGWINMRHGRYSDGFVRRDEKSITQLYRDNGFRDARVDITANDSYKGKHGDVAVTVQIEEGEQYLVSRLKVNGLTRPDREEIINRLAMLPGQPFSEAGVAVDRDMLTTLFQSAGYPDVDFDWRLVSDPSQRDVEIVYNIEEGQPRFVRDVLIMGLRETKPRLVNRNILLKPGDPLSWTTMGQMQRRLYDLGVFDKVDMAIRNPQGETESKFVLFHMTEGHRYYSAIGVGLEAGRIGGSQTSLDAPVGTAGISPRIAYDFSRLNLWGLGHSVNFRSAYSRYNQRASINYLAPRFQNVPGRDISVTLLYYNTRDIRTYTATRYEGTAQISNRFSKATTGYLRYTWRHNLVDQNTLKINPLLIPILSQPSRIGMISGNLIQDHRDDPTDAHRGFFNTLDVGLVDHYFGGNKNFLRFLGRTALYHRIRGDVVLAHNTQFGVIQPFLVPPGTDPGTYVPLPERFWAGGSMTNRGFPESQAGPRDLDTGFPIAGNAMFFNSTELRFPLIGQNIRGVFFHDMGNVYTDVGSISFRVHQRNLADFDYMVHAVGFGVRYRTPIGPIRLDFAYSINPPTFHGLEGNLTDLINGTATPTIRNVSHFQFFLSIGQAF